MPIVVASVLVVMLVVLIAIWISRKSGKGNESVNYIIIYIITCISHTLLT